MIVGASELKKVRRFRTILDSLSEFPADEVDKVDRLIQAGELSVALENLCTQLYEFDIKVPTELLTLIAQLGRELKVDESYWSVLDQPPTTVADREDGDS
jgi:hypothetical protein